MAEEPEDLPDLVEDNPPAKSAEDRKAQAALSALDNRDDDSPAGKDLDQDAVRKAMDRLALSGAVNGKVTKKDEVKSVPKVTKKIDPEHVAYIVCGGDFDLDSGSIQSIPSVDSELPCTSFVVAERPVRTLPMWFHFGFGDAFIPTRPMSISPFLGLRQPEYLLSYRTSPAAQIQEQKEASMREFRNLLGEAKTPLPESIFSMFDSVAELKAEFHFAVTGATATQDVYYDPSPHVQGIGELLEVTRKFNRLKINQCIRGLEDQIKVFKRFQSAPTNRSQVQELELPKTKATEMLRAHDGDIEGLLKEFITLRASLNTAS